MSEPKNHHWVPKFLLKKWALPTGKVPTWTHAGPNNKIYLDFKSTKSICSKYYLYNLELTNESSRNTIETKFLQRLDSNIATIVKKIERNSALTDIEENLFCVFLHNLHFRHPETINRMENYGRNFNIIEEVLQEAIHENKIRKDYKLLPEIKEKLIHDSARMALIR